MLLTFFSRAGENYGVDDTEVGNTEVIAGYIKDYFGDKIDVFKLEPVNPYPDAYQECTEIAKREKTENARPAFQGEVDLSAHDTIFLGYPIWWGEPPMIINTFLDKYDLRKQSFHSIRTPVLAQLARTRRSKRSYQTLTSILTAWRLWVLMLELSPRRVLSRHG